MGVLLWEYYRDGEYVSLAATVKKVDIMARELVFDGTMIDFDDIYDLDVQALLIWQGLFFVMCSRLPRFV